MLRFSPDFVSVVFGCGKDLHCIFWVLGLGNAEGALEVWGCRHTYTLSWGAA